MRESFTLPAHASKIAEAGRPHRSAVRNFVKCLRAQGVSLEQVDAKLEPVAAALSAWPSRDIPPLFRGLKRALEKNPRLDLDRLPRWINEHRSFEDRVTRTVKCAEVLPPTGFVISDLRSASTAQKLVFGADWRDGQRAVVLKLPVGPDEEQIFDNEATVHRLSMAHPNIIETHVFSNSEGVRFLVEELLDPLNEEWKAGGIDEAANLLYDIGSALAFLAEDHDLVHRDLKPDNLARHGDSFVLLDFGVCGRKQEVERRGHPTGTTKTRAPEVLKGSPQTPKSDVWALGATVFFGIAGRFPLFEPGEEPPPLRDRKRKAFERDLRTRAEKGFDERVLDPLSPSGQAINRFEPLREILHSTLAENPDDRVSARELCKTAQESLAPYIRGEADRVSAVDELRQLASSFAKDVGSLQFMSPLRRRELKETLDRLGRSPGLSTEDRDTLKELQERFKAAP